LRKEEKNGAEAANAASIAQSHSCVGSMAQKLLC
jgi:hypothetical protein